MKMSPHDIYTTLLSRPPSKRLQAGILPTAPEFVDSKGLRSLFGISSAHGYLLAEQARSKSVCHTQSREQVRGKRLWECPSVRIICVPM